MAFEIQVTDWILLFVQPATVAGIGLLVLAFLTFRDGSVMAVRCLAVGLVLVYFTFASPIGANTLVGLLEEAATPSADCAQPSGASVFFVLAGGMTGEPASEKDYVRLKLASLRRVLGAARLARELPDSLLIMSGGAGRAVREADLMGSLAVTLGIGRDRIMVERESTSTYESAMRAPSILRTVPGRPVFLVTSAMHIPRALAVFRSSGIAACPYPLDWQQIYPAPAEAFLPQLSALVKGTAAFHELLGYAGYWLTGKI